MIRRHRETVTIARQSLMNGFTEVKHNMMLKHKIIRTISNTTDHSVPSFWLTEKLSDPRRTLKLIGLLCLATGFVALNSPAQGQQLEPLKTQWKQADDWHNNQSCQIKRQQAKALPLPQHDYSVSGHTQGQTLSQRLAQSRHCQASILEYGANGTDDKPDTLAFIKAIKDPDLCALLIPNGTYYVDQQLLIKRPLLIYGQSQANSKIIFTKHLTELNYSGNPSYQGGLFQITGRMNKTGSPATVVKATAPGTVALTLSSSLDPKAKLFEIRLSPIGNTSPSALTQSLYAGQSGGVENSKGIAQYRYNAKVIYATGTIKAKTLTLDQPFSLAIRPDQWLTQVSAITQPAVGFQMRHLSLDFLIPPEQAMRRQHTKELGYNAIDLRYGVNSVISDLTILNSDLAISINGYNNRIENITLDYPDRRPYLSGAFEGQQVWLNGSYAHHGILLYGTDSVAHNIQIKKPISHAVTFGFASHNNVASRFRGPQLSIDGHKIYPTGSLVTDFKTQDSHRLWLGGGNRGLGKHFGRDSVFWNITSHDQAPKPSNNFSDQSALYVNVDSEQNKAIGQWVMLPSAPPNLYTYQREIRQDCLK